MHYRIDKKEKDRLSTLESYSILDTLPEEDYDGITRIAAQICGTEISLVSLVDADRQWFKSHFGIEATETPREYSFCSRAISSNKDVYIIENAPEHPVYKNNPLVTGPPNIMFYAGVPLEGEKGFKLGSLCVIDSKKKSLTDAQIDALRALGKQVENLLKLRKNQMDLDRLITELRLKNESLEQFAYVAAHDIKSPLNNIRGLVQLILKNDRELLEEKVLKKLEMVYNTSDKLKRLVDALLEYSQVSNIVNQVSKIDTRLIFKNISELHASDHVNLKIENLLPELYFNDLALYQLIHNFVVNAIKYNDKQVVEINISLTSDKANWVLKVKDNGVGIAEENFDKVFETFTTLKTKDKYGNFGNGLGLSIVKKIVEEYKGKIKIESKLGIGTCFTVIMPILHS